MTVPRFLNVDLDLYASAGLGPLVRALQPQMHVQHERDDFASLELSSGPTPPMDKVLNGIAEVVEGLPLAARRAWKACERRVMNAGFEAGTGLPTEALIIPALTLKRLVSLGAEIEITIYAARSRKPLPRKAPRRRRKSRV